MRTCDNNINAFHSPPLFGGSGCRIRVGWRGWGGLVRSVSVWSRVREKRLFLSKSAPGLK